MKTVKQLLNESIKKDVKWFESNVFDTDVVEYVRQVKGDIYLVGAKAENGNHYNIWTVYLDMKTGEHDFEPAFKDKVKRQDVKKFIDKNIKKVGK